jgi:hypothetical protein
MKNVRCLCLVLLTVAISCNVAYSQTILHIGNKEIFFDFTLILDGSDISTISKKDPFTGKVSTSVKGGCKFRLFVKYSGPEEGHFTMISDRVWFVNENLVHSRPQNIEYPLDIIILRVGDTIALKNDTPVGPWIEDPTEEELSSLQNSLQESCDANKITGFALNDSSQGFKFKSGKIIKTQDFWQHTTVRLAVQDKINREPQISKKIDKNELTEELAKRNLNDFNKALERANLKDFVEARKKGYLKDNKGIYQCDLQSISEQSCVAVALDYFKYKIDQNCLMFDVEPDGWKIQRNEFGFQICETGQPQNLITIELTGNLIADSDQFISLFGGYGFEINDSYKLFSKTVTHEDVMVQTDWLSGILSDILSDLSNNSVHPMSFYTLIY